MLKSRCIASEGPTKMFQEQEGRKRKTTKMTQTGHNLRERGKGVMPHPTSCQAPRALEKQGQRSRCNDKGKNVASISGTKKSRKTMKEMEMGHD